MENFKLGNDVVKAVNDQLDTSVGQIKNLGSRQELNP